ncbi:MAG: metallophosphoesterase family protein [Planctomycetota bacterium]|jgi:diadenosine tetraphosphatase ApaH/serine/threonine PP2A family protein phosphatase|nr:metallophosphatase family protein [Planctomycetota bacterium]MDP6838186.1 metallophosphoesterase family protein [Planctomycetota bacterium]MDP6957029.1 metallophosphoesterase family protein [Planctomycetota bacterium]
MKYGILGDIHANLCALEAVLAGLADAEVEVLLAVGDVVGYGAAPAACLDLLRQYEVAVVLGNHEQAVIEGAAAWGFNHAALAAVSWTRDQLSRTDRAWLAQLPLLRIFDHALLAHASPAAEDGFPYVLNAADADGALDGLSRPVCFVGHTHVPATFMRTVQDPVRTAISHDSFIDLSDTELALVNVGSVGQPRDGDPRAAYAVYDSDRRTLRIERAVYDVEREAARITGACLPASLAERLFVGR